MASQIFEALEEEITCSICFEKKDLHELPCQHSYCASCINKLKPLLTRRITCPECRQVSKLPKGKGAAYPKNRLAIKIDERLQQLKAEHDDQLSAGPQQTDISASHETDHLSCRQPDHSGDSRSAEVICSKCRQVMCALCGLRGHCLLNAKHECKPIDDAYKESKELLTEHIKQLEQVFKNAQSQSKSVQGRLEKLTVKYNQDKAALEKELNEMEACQLRQAEQLSFFSVKASNTDKLSVIAASQEIDSQDIPTALSQINYCHGNTGRVKVPFVINILILTYALFYMSKYFFVPNAVTPQKLGVELDIEFHHYDLQSPIATENSKKITVLIKNGRRFVLDPDDCTVTISDSVTHEPVYSTQIQSKSCNNVAMATLSDGTLVISSAKGTIDFHNSEDGHLLKSVTFPVLRESVCQLVALPTGGFIVSSCQQTGNKQTIAFSSSGEMVWTSDIWGCLTLHSSNYVLVADSVERGVILLSPNGEKVKTLIQSALAPTCVTAQDEKMVVKFEDGSIAVYRLIS